ncbi:ABC transporter permease subunit [Paracoccus litorisediminis]|uniref:ABC transporter permease subunit n=1 Tax=Paracoccus litorisediminis TaxID=2006130 RepID=A0A844HYG0_9RHOB|nr:ABC transporter permease [Paracoccus litorisediminis]MTH62482.1 ABC transporter permease subunit [Paracoccus litorisediminis]
MDGASRALHGIGHRGSVASEWPDDRGQAHPLGEDYIRTARAKGLLERKVVLRHGMPSTPMTLVTQLGTDIGLMLGGVIVIEQVYGLQGVGSLAVQTVGNQDRPTIICMVLLGGLFIALCNIIVDLLYAALDPRLR